MTEYEVLAEAKIGNPFPFVLIAFCIIEMIRRKPIPPEKEGYVNLAGMALLFVIVILVLFNDISRFFR